MKTYTPIILHVMSMTTFSTFPMYVGETHKKKLKVTIQSRKWHWPWNYVTQITCLFACLVKLHIGTFCVTLNKYFIKDTLHLYPLLKGFASVQFCIWVLIQGYHNLINNHRRANTFWSGNIYQWILLISSTAVKF